MSRVVSFRLSTALADRVRSDVRQARMTVSQALRLLLAACARSPDLIACLPDSPHNGPAKLDVRLSDQTFQNLESACKRTSLPRRVYIRRALYHFCETKTVWLIKGTDGYTLAKVP